MAYEDVRPGDRFSITFRTPQHGVGQWHLVAERADPEVARRLYEEVIADDRDQGAVIGSRWRLCHDRGSEVIRVLEDKTLDHRGIVPSGNSN